MRAGFKHYRFMLDGFDKIIIPKEDEEQAYNQCLHDVIENPRYYLDNLEHIKEFQVSWLYYGSRANCKKNRRYYASSHPKTNSFINKTSVNIYEVL